MGHAALLDSISQDRKDARKAAGERDKKAKERVQRLYQKDKERKQQAAQQVAVKSRAGRPHLTYVPLLEPPEALPGCGLPGTARPPLSLLCLQQAAVIIHCFLRHFAP